MSTVFGKDYAEAYDTLYHDKDYAGEVTLLERIFRKYASTPIRRVLDLGCGTGNHSLLLAAHSFDVVGVDRSSDMLARAEAKTKERGLKVSFYRSAISDLNLAERFDAALMMFVVLGYHHSNEEVLGALRAVRAHPNPGGLLAFDVWYGPAVLIHQPGERVRVIESGNERTLRASASRLDILNHLCRIDYRLWRLRGEALSGYETETHVVRYFFPKELELYLGLNGFKLLRLGAFPNFDDEVDDSTWNVLVVAEAV